MAHIAPSISFIREVISGIEQGKSVGQVLDAVVLLDQADFFKKMKVWWSIKKSGGEPPQIFRSHYQQSLIEILENGLLGGAIHDHLCRLEAEMIQEFERQWKAFLESLPLKLSVPLLLFFFPSYVVLLFGPLLVQFLMEVN
jgi:hypothetical protein